MSTAVGVAALCARGLTEFTLLVRVAISAVPECGGGGGGGAVVVAERACAPYVRVRACVQMKRV